MKTNCWLILGTMLATTAVAQVNTNKLPEIPPPAVATPAAPAPTPVMTATDTQTNAPTKKKALKAKKKPAKKTRIATKAIEKKASEMPVPPVLPVTLVPGPATVAADHVNLRGQAGVQGEVVGHVQKGDTVTVIAEITLDKPKAGEPAQWAKIALPAGTKVWINSKFVDPSNSVVTARKLNLRGGPGENYSVLGIIEKGAAVTAVTTKNDWTQIQTPDSAFAFVAAGYLKQEGAMADTNAAVPPTVAATMPTPPPTSLTPTATAVPEAQPIAPPATTPPPTPEAATPPAPVPPTPTPAPVPESAVMSLPPPTLAPDNETDTNLPPPPPRVVTHEGSVRPSVSLVAPTDFELYDPSDNKAINYLYSTTTNLNLSRYNGLHITVTGEEGLDARWKDTPVLTIQKIYVLSSGKPKDNASTPAPQ